MNRLFNEQRILSVIVLLMTAALVLSTFGLTFADLGGAFSPMFFPRIILTVLLCLAVLNVIIDFAAEPQRRPIELKPVVLISGALIVYMLIIMPLGYFLSSVLVGSFILMTLGLRNPIQIVGIPFVAAGGLVVLFNHTLKMPLPTSPLVWWI